VNIGTRIKSTNEQEKVHISEATRQILEPSDGLTVRGTIELKNRGEMKTCFLDNLK